tara:strand:- start:718 stop:948 length:231 start_codon:yes stop_codon:yes gene_type:complete
MKNNVININAAKYHVPSVRRIFEVGGHTIDGYSGYLRMEIIGILEECAIAFECDYQELSVGDVLEYLVAREEERQR